MLKHPKLKRYLSFWTYAFCNIGVPIILISDKYDLFRERTSQYKLTAAAVVVFMIVLFSLRNWIKGYINNLPLGNTGKIKLSTILSALKMPLTLFVFYILVYWVNGQLQGIEYILLITTISNFIGAGFLIWHDFVVAEIKLEREVVKKLKIEKSATANGEV